MFKVNAGSPTVSTKLQELMIDSMTPNLVASDPARPFLKWVGGKSQLIKELDTHLPERLKEGKHKTYIEPFIGGGALFFHVARNYQIERFILADTNRDLILAYKTIQGKVGRLIAILHDLQTKFLKLDQQKREAFYYKVRAKFNSEKADFSLDANHWLRRTSQLIFLNKTCFNGLYRVNSDGLFNASFGKYANPKICDPDNLIEVSFVLRKALILNCDFEETLKLIDEDSFVYIDPPYRPLSQTANFTSYSPDTFTAHDQERLAQFCRNVNDAGAQVLISSADPSNVDPDDRYFEENYSDFRILKTQANRMINCRADRRGKINELLIMNY